MTAVLTKEKASKNGREKREINPSVKVILVTPAIAQEFLLKNTNNRPIRTNKVDFFADIIRKGQWEINNDGICFDYNGILINGQHRLTAVVRTGKSVKMIIITGLAPEAFGTIDLDGTKRTTGDGLAHAGISEGNAKAAIVKFYMYYRKGNFADRGSRARSNITNMDLVNFIKENNEKVEMVHAAAKKICRRFNPIPSRYIGGIYWLLHDISASHADAFFELYSSGVNLTPRNPIHVLRQRLINDMASTKKYNVTNKLAWLVMAWNYYRRSQSIASIRWNEAEDNFPKPI